MTEPCRSDGEEAARAKREHASFRNAQRQLPWHAGNGFDQSVDITQSSGRLPNPLLDRGVVRRRQVLGPGWIRCGSTRCYLALALAQAHERWIQERKSAVSAT